MRTQMLGFAVVVLALWADAAETNRAMGFSATTEQAATCWQVEAREQLFALMMGGAKPKSVPLDAKILQRIEMPAGGYVLEELSLQTLPDRRVHAWMTVPMERKRKVGAVLALHGHGGTGSQIVRGEGLYWYGWALAEMGYVVISPDIGQHDLQDTILKLPDADADLDADGLTLVPHLPPSITELEQLDSGRFGSLSGLTSELNS